MRSRRPSVSGVSGLRGHPIPVLTILVGVGFVVWGGGRDPAAATPDYGSGLSAVVEEMPGGTAVHPASGPALKTGEARGPGRGPRSRERRAPGAVGSLADALPASRAAACGTLASRAGSFHRHASSVAGFLHHDALRRSGRLSAPATAPPVAPF